MAETSRNNWVVGQSVFGFVVLQIEKVSFANSLLLLLEHEKTGARYLHLQNEHSNNCFGIAFRTLPDSSNGVAHVLEHMVLCGSQNYPVRDPFFAAMKSSLKTYMNAMTSSIWSLFFFATRNEKDFDNLLAVQLDGVFFPLLEEEAFWQEGYRSEPAPTGIVYNEMRGSLSNPERLLYQYTKEALFPTLPYRLNAGGNPDEISTLTVEDIRKFHRRYYIPSNAIFYSYGNFPLETRLQFVDKNALSKFGRVEGCPAVGLEKRYGGPQQFKRTYFIQQQGESKSEFSYCVLGWLLCESFDVQEVLLCHLFEEILLGDTISTLRAALENSDWNCRLTMESGYHTEFRESFFCIGLQGVAADEAACMEQFVRGVLKAAAESGIAKDLIEIAFRQLELQLRDLSKANVPFGMEGLFRCWPAVLYNLNPAVLLNLETEIEKLKQKVATPGFLESRLRRFFLENPHQICLTLSPEALESDRALDETDPSIVRENSRSQTKLLSDYQSRQEDLACLPRLSLGDIERRIPDAGRRQFVDDGVPVTAYERNVNGLFYFFFEFKLRNLAVDEQLLLPLLCDLLPESGLRGRSREKVLGEIRRRTGGFECGVEVEAQADDIHAVGEYLTFSGMGLGSDASRALELGVLFLTEWDFSNVNLIRRAILDRLQRLRLVVWEAGHRLAMFAASRGFTKVCRIRDFYGGMEQIRFVESLTGLSDKGLLLLRERLERLARKVLVREGLAVLLIGESDILAVGRRELGRRLIHFAPEVCGGEAHQGGEFEFWLPCEAWCASVGVAHLAYSIRVGCYVERECPLLMVVSYLLRNEFLHRGVREKGGAYGGMTKYDAVRGVFSLLSFRDPCFSNSLVEFERALGRVCAGEFTREHMEGAIFQAIGGMDVGEGGFEGAVSDHLNFRRGKTRDRRQVFRDGVLDCGKGDLVEAARLFFVDVSAAIGVVADLEMFERESDVLEARGFNLRRLLD